MVKKKFLKWFLILVSIPLILLGIFIVILLVYRVSHKPVYKEVTYHQVIEWGKDNNINKFIAPFLQSCTVFNKYPDNKVITTNPQITLAKDWKIVCKALKEVDSTDATVIKKFIENNFTPFLVNSKNSAHITGYYRPEFKGSLVKTPKFKYPLYQVPKDLVRVNVGDFIPSVKNQVIYGKVENGKLVKYYSREQIMNGALKDHTLPLVWLSNPVDVFLLHVQGSGVIITPNGQPLYVMYAAKNGYNFVGIFNYMREHKLLPKNPNIKGLDIIYNLLNEHPAKVDEVLSINPSYIFFKRVDINNWTGALGTKLYSERTVAVDPEYEPLGLPLWIVMSNQQNKKPLTHMVVANDVGSAIKGPARIDFYWGVGKGAGEVAGYTNQLGSLYILLPKVND